MALNVQDRDFGWGFFPDMSKKLLPLIKKHQLQWAEESKENITQEDNAILANNHVGTDIPTAFNVDSFGWDPLPRDTVNQDLEHNSHALIQNYLLEIISKGDVDADRPLVDFDIMNDFLNISECRKIIDNNRKKEQEIRPVLALIVFDGDKFIPDNLRINAFLLLYHTFSSRKSFMDEGWIRTEEELFQNFIEDVYESRSEDFFVELGVEIDYTE